MVKESAKRLTVLLWMLALMLVAAVPALAQGEEQYAPEGLPGEEIVATGVIEKRVGASVGGYGSHDLLDSETGEILYTLISDSVDLDAHNGQRVTIYGTVLDPRLYYGATGLNVYQVEPLEGEGETTTPPAEDNDPVNEADGSGSSNGSVDEAAVEETAGESNAAGNAAGSVAERAGVQVLPDTGGAPLMILGVGTLLMAAGLLIRRR